MISPPIDTCVHGTACMYTRNFTHELEVELLVNRAGLIDRVQVYDFICVRCLRLLGVYPGRPPLGQGPPELVVRVTELPPKGEGVSVPVASRRAYKYIYVRTHAGAPDCNIYLASKLEVDNHTDRASCKASSTPEGRTSYIGKSDRREVSRFL